MTETASAQQSTAGKGLGVAGLVFAFLAAPLGLILSLVARSQSKKAGIKNGAATAGIVISLLGIIGIIIFAVVAGGSAAALLGQCAELGAGVHELDSGLTVTCG